MTEARTHDEQYERALVIAREQGTRDGRNAAEWYAQDAFGGRVTHGARESAERILKGIEDGDPEIMDTIPSPDMSGQWADEPTGSDIACVILEDVTGETYRDAYTGIYHLPEEWEDAETDILDAYEQAYRDAATDKISELARIAIGEDE